MTSGLLIKEPQLLGDENKVPRNALYQAFLGHDLDEMLILRFLEIMKEMISFCLPLRIAHIANNTEKLNDFNVGH